MIDFHHVGALRHDLFEICYDIACRSESEEEAWKELAQTVDAIDLETVSDVGCFTDDAIEEED